MKKYIYFTILTTFFFLLPLKEVHAQVASDEGDSVLQKIKQKVETIRKNPKAFAGTVTDKTQDSIQVKNLTGKIEQISIKGDVAFVKIGKSPSQIKFADIAIGDFIVAMGYTNGNSLLDAKRILLTAPPPELKRKMFMGEISEMKKREIIITDSNNQINAFSFPVKWKGPDLKVLKTGMKVFVISLENDKGVQIIRTIQITDDLLSPTPPQKIKLSPQPSE